jgi:MFS family permease
MNRPAAFAPLREPEYRRYYIGQLISVLGTWMQSIALPWMAYTISGSALAVGLVALCGHLGMMLLPPIAGVWGDRVNKRKLLIGLYIFLFFPSAALAVLAYTGKAQVWQLALIAVISGIGSGVEMPIRWASFAEMLKDKTLLPNAIALNAAALNIGRVLGPAIGGALIAWVGEAACFAVNALSFLAVVWQLSRSVWGAVADSGPSSGLWASFKEGAKASFSDPFVRAGLVTVGMVSFALGNYNTVLPVFVKDVLRGDAQMLGALMSSMGIGALSSTLYLATRKGRGLTSLVLIAATTGGVCYILMGAMRSLSMAPVLMVGLGLGMILTFSSINTMIQLHVDPAQRSRVMGFYSWAVMGVAPASAFFAGAATEAFGPTATMILSGTVSLLAAGLFWVLRRNVGVAP